MPKLKTIKEKSLFSSKKALVSRNSQKRIKGRISQRIIDDLQPSPKTVASQKKNVKNPSLKLPALSAIKKYSKQQSKSSLIPKKKSQSKTLRGILSSKKEKLTKVKKIPSPLTATSRAKKSNPVPNVLKQITSPSFRQKKRKIILDEAIIKVPEPVISAAELKPVAFQEHPPENIFVDDTRIPEHYDKTWITLILKDPHWLYATWELSADVLSSYPKEFPNQFQNSKIVLRMYDVTCVSFNGSNANYYFDLEVGPSTNNWYINLWMDNVSYCTEIGMRTVEGRFIPLSRSNVVQTPRVGHSWRSEQIWMEVKGPHDEQKPYLVISLKDKKNFVSPPRVSQSKTIHRRIYLTADDIRRYYAQLMPFLKKVLTLRLEKKVGRKTLDRYRYMFLDDEQTPDALYRLSGKALYRKIFVGASEELSILETTDAAASDLRLSASETLQQGKKRKFFFELWADVIVYGRTEPDAAVWMKEQKIPLRTDGTFTLRYSLPDSTIPLEFKAVSADQLEERSITTVLNRQTQYFMPVMLRER